MTTKEFEYVCICVFLALLATLGSKKALFPSFQHIPVEHLAKFTDTLGFERMKKKHKYVCMLLQAHFDVICVISTF